MNYEDTSGHIALSRIIGGVVGAGAGAWVGSKIAKKTNAKGWKKAAIIAGCAVAGGVIGAIAGPRVAKLAKKVVNYTKPKLKTVKSTLQKSISKKSNLGLQKSTTKTRIKNLKISDASPVNGKGAYNGNFNRNSGFGKLTNKKLNVSQKGIDKIKKHITSNNFDAPENDLMIARLEKAFKQGKQIDGADASFYMHELKESTLMNQGMGYDMAHSKALEIYQVSPFSVYHPEVIKLHPQAWGTNWLKFWGL